MNADEQTIALFRAELNARAEAKWQAETLKLIEREVSFQIRRRDDLRRAATRQPYYDISIRRSNQRITDQLKRHP